MDLKTRTPRGFAFVRYADQSTAERAVENLHDTNLGSGRNIQVEIVHSKTYLGQDESDTMRVAKYA